MSHQRFVQRLSRFSRLTLVNCLGCRAFEMRFVLPSAWMLTLPVTSFDHDYTVQQIAPMVSMDSEDDADIFDRLSLSSVISILISLSDSVSPFFGSFGVSINFGPI